MLRILFAFLTTFTLLAAASVLAQESASASDRIDLPQGGAQTLEDILARQRGETVDNDFRRQFGDPEGAADIAQQLGTLGWRL